MSCLWQGYLYLSLGDKYENYLVYTIIYRGGFKPGHATRSYFTKKNKNKVEHCDMWPNLIYEVVDPRS